MAEVWLLQHHSGLECPEIAHYDTDAVEAIGSPVARYPKEQVMQPGTTPPQTFVVDTSESPYAKLRPVPLTAVDLTEGFWRSRREQTRTVTLRSQLCYLETTGRLDNFRRAAGHLDVDFQGIYFNDSDVYKWLEAASWALADGADAELNDLVAEVVTVIEEAQGADGYLDTYFTFEREGERWTNLRDLHELYCAGHLFQAAVAHYRATGTTRLLDVARRLADLICTTFGLGSGQRAGTSGHPEIEMGLVELYRATGDSRYLDQARYFIDARGQGVVGGSPYHQDHVPFRELDRLTGHAVRALYLSAGATDVVAETGDPGLRQAVKRLWDHMAMRQVYITGGLGARHQGESVGADFELPNARAYAETCAGIANVMWAWRMLQLDGASTYMDLMERALYNAALPGLSLDGTNYFYVNPLATDGQPEPGGKVTQRQPWFGCACCPPNIARTLAQMPGYLYSVDGDAIWLNTYAPNEALITLPDGRTIKLIQRTLYPWNGQVIVELLTAGTFSINVRIPGWCEADSEAERPSVSVNGGACPGDVDPGHYLHIHRTWAVGDSVCIQLPMPVRRVEAHPYALENAGRIALMRGPLLYCLEAADHPGVDLRDVVLPPEAQLTTAFRKDLLGGVEIIEGEGLVAQPGAGWEDALYRRAQPKAEALQPIRITAVPYFAWANREVGAMQVWLRQA